MGWIREKSIITMACSKDFFSHYKTEIMLRYLNGSDTNNQPSIRTSTQVPLHAFNYCCIYIQNVYKFYIVRRVPDKKFFVSTFLFTFFHC